MAEQPRTPRRGGGNFDTSYTPRCLRSREQNSNITGSQPPDRRNGIYPGRVFYPTRHNRDQLTPHVSSVKDTTNITNNNIAPLEEASGSTIETRDLFKELPMADDDTTVAARPTTAEIWGFPGSEIAWYFPPVHISPQGYYANYSQMTSRISNRMANLPHTITSGVLSEEWANAPEFIPQSSSSNLDASEEGSASGVTPTSSNAYTPGEYTHGDRCDICGASCLHPVDKFKRKIHRRLCQQLHDKGAESTTAAVERSKDKTCGICFEAVMEKPIGERRFGILTMCNHCFCLECIRKWRQARNFENKVVKSCPECRITSDFVCPSIYWVDTKEEKDLLIEKYKNALSEKHCKYFGRGRGVCPFGNKCFYLHALPNGTKTDVGPPPRRRRHYRQQEDLELSDMLQQIILWDIHDDHEHRWLYSFADDLEELASFFSDSDESEWSDYDFF